MQVFDLLAYISACIWITIFLLPWKPYSTKEVLDSSDLDIDSDFYDITVVIPARNESKIIKNTLMALNEQGKRLNIVLVDDESTDGTSEIARDMGLENLKIIKGKPLPKGWTGKIWALEQGLQLVNTPYTLFIDADIIMKNRILATLKDKMIKEDWDMISLMAALSMNKFWEKMLIPSFIYFFKLLYPFSLSNKRSSKIAAAAGGCMFVKTKALRDIGGFQSIKDEIIDDCALAKRLKQAGNKIWIGLTRSVISQRKYTKLSDIWNMVARTAFTQLKYSISLLILCTIMMAASFIFPFLGLLSNNIYAILISWLALSVMIITYMPTIKFYGLSKLWALTLPISGVLYLMMTWSSAIRFFMGKRSEWKGRTYSAHNVS